MPRFAVLTIGVAGDLLCSALSNMPASSLPTSMQSFRPALTVDILLPVGISFYTFTQIAFLVDAYRGNVARYALPHYALFVTYFPHLIAGPILHHKEMMPQFERAEPKAGPASDPVRTDHLRDRPVQENRSCRRHPAAGRRSRSARLTPSFDQAWIGALAYTLQLYFDFSGYSDMAIGISLMFGIFLPLNFNSPYKATSIIDFWRRWHMTLSHFLRDYLYIPARRQPARAASALREPDDHDAARRPLARRGLDLRGLGRAAWRVSLRQSRLELFRSRLSRRASRVRRPSRRPS